MSLWQMETLAEILDCPPAGAVSVEGISIDTRTLQTGDLFVALKDHGDGHDFVLMAAEKGAAAALVSRKMEVDLPQLIVPDVLEALQKIAVAARQRCPGMRVAITGSCGKTTVKEFLATVLQAHKPEESYNNHWGVPLTLARMPEDSRFAVLEIGMNAAGEIGPLSELVQPHVVMVTNIAPAHIGAFPGMDELAAEKLSITSGLPPGGYLVTHIDVEKRFKRAIDTSIITYGFDEKADVRGISTEPAEYGGQQVEADITGQRVSFRLPVAGQHMAENALAVLAAAKVLEVDMENVVNRLSDVSLMPGRGTVHKVEGVCVIDESFNANPSSVQVALQTLRANPSSGRKYAILGDMLELGDGSDDYHRDLAEFCDGIDGVMCVGEKMHLLYETLPEACRLGHHKDQAEISMEGFASGLRQGDMVLVKGSKKMFWVDNFVPRLIEVIEKQEISRGAF